MKNVVLIMAAGQSRRCGFDKLLATMGETSVLEQSLQTFVNCPVIDDIWVVGKPYAAQGKIRGWVEGGNTRFESVQRAIKHCTQQYTQNVRLIVHNAANPHLRREDLEEGLKMTEQHHNLIFGFFSPNSIKQVSKEGIVINFLDREQIFETQTPQIAPLLTFNKALEAYQVRTQNISDDELELKTQEPRDEAELIALTGEPIAVYECDPSNTKITFASDLLNLQCLGRHSSHQGGRLGIGEDSHAFADTFNPEKPFRLGGIDASENRLSSNGNSDGDVIIHALCNALLSAYGDKTFDPIAAPICAAGDTHSESYLKATLEHLYKTYNAHIPSALRACCAKQHSLPLNSRGAKISQLLISLEGAQPKIAPLHDAIVRHLATLLQIPPHKIGLTYTTGEGLNAVGRGEGIRSFVIVLFQ